MSLPPINLNDLDFNSIKANLRNYLSTKSEFQGFDFNGSALSSLLDVLTYNTYYQ